MKLPITFIGLPVTILAGILAITILLIDKKAERHKKEIITLQTGLQSLKKAETRTALSKIEVTSSWIMRHSSQISEAAAKQIAEEVFKVPNPILMISLIEVESLFIQSAVSKAGAVGLGQIMFEVHKKALAEIGISKKRDLFNIDCNIKASSFILQGMIKRSNGDLTKALHLYLGGKDGRYVARIFSNYIHLSMEIENALPKM